MKKIFPICAALLCLALEGGCRPPVEIPEGFVQTPSSGLRVYNPELNELEFSSEWYELNHSWDEFRVEVVDGRLKISRRILDSKREFRTPEGTLHSVNRGEFGGELYFDPADPTVGRSLVMYGNVVDIFRYRGGIYAIHGLAHLSLSFGALYRLLPADTTFRSEEVIRFDDAPRAISVYKNKVYIVTAAGFRVWDGSECRVIFRDMFWTALYPNSVAVIDKNHAFIGIRGGIVGLDLDKVEVTFYKYTGPSAETY